MQEGNAWTVHAAPALAAVWLTLQESHPAEPCPPPNPPNLCARSYEVAVAAAWSWVDPLMPSRVPKRCPYRVLERAQPVSQGPCHYVAFA